MWGDVGQQLGTILSKEIFGCLIETPSYSVFLERAGVDRPFERFLKYRSERFPDSYAATCQEYARLIAGQVKSLNCLVEGPSLRAEVLHGPLRLYRLMQNRKKPPEPADLRRHTGYFGDWWFEEPLLKLCERLCASQEAARCKEPLLTTMTPEACLKTQLRRRMAISVDWNGIGAIRRLTLAPNESLPVITGEGLPMPYLSRTADWRKHPDKGKPVARQQLPGGDRQIWLIWTPQKHTIGLYKTF